LQVKINGRRVKRFGIDPSNAEVQKLFSEDGGKRDNETYGETFELKLPDKALFISDVNYYLKISDREEGKEVKEEEKDTRAQAHFGAFVFFKKYA
jgi:hypothetical protein